MAVVAKVVKAPGCLMEDRGSSPSSTVEQLSKALNPVS